MRKARNWTNSSLMDLPIQYFLIILARHFLKEKYIYVLFTFKHLIFTIVNGCDIKIAIGGSFCYIEF